MSPSALRILESGVARRVEVLSADPHNVRVRNLLITDYARLGGILRDMGRTGDARATFEKGFHVAKAGDPDSLKSPDVLGSIEDLRKEAARARQAGGPKVTPAPLSLLYTK